MALVGNTNIRYTGTQTNQIKEHVLDMLIDTAPMDTPGLTLMQRGEKPKNIVYQWLTDYSGAYPDSTDDIQWRGEGQDADPAATDGRSMIGNRTGIVGRAFSVSFTQEEVSLFGIESEYRHQAVKIGRQLMRQLEFAIFYSLLDIDSNGPNAGSAGTKRKFGGMVEQCQVGASYVALGGGVTFPTEAKGYVANVASGSGTLALSDIITAQKTLWTRGGVMGTGTVFASSRSKELVSKLLSPYPGQSGSFFRRYFGMDAQAEINLTVDRVQTDFGDLELVLSRAVRQADLIRWDTDQYYLHALRPMQLYPIAQIGSSKTGLLEGEYTTSLRACNSVWVLRNILQ